MDKKSVPAPRTSTLSDDTVNEAKAQMIFGRGYKRPPKEHQFQKGQSGNPKGRPKKPLSSSMGDRSANAILLREAERKIPIKDGGETTEMAMIEVVIRSLATSAAKGNPHAQKYFAEAYRQAEEQRRSVLETSNEIFLDYQKRCRVETEAAIKAELQPPEHLPHPDDIIVDPERGVRFVGPIDKDELADIEKTCRIRDTLILQDELDRRSAPKGSTIDSNGRTSSMLLAMWINHMLPPRFQLQNDDIEDQLKPAGHLTKRQLLKQQLKAWRSIGLPIPRGYTSPPFDRVLNDLNKVMDAYHQLMMES